LKSIATPEDLKHKEAVLPQHTADRLMRVTQNLEGVHIRGRGCPACKELGIVAQTVTSEVIVTDEQLLRHIRKGEIGKAYTYWLKDMKGRTYIQHAIEGIEAGLLDPHLTELRMGAPLDFTRSQEGA
jgi:type II secretory ATPase GspE/PulE/Tfp pilus assembly ATPase PilB-like protein